MGEKQLSQSRGREIIKIDAVIGERKGRIMKINKESVTGKC